MTLRTQTETTVIIDDVVLGTIYWPRNDFDPLFRLYSRKTGLQLWSASSLEILLNWIKINWNQP